MTKNRKILYSFNDLFRLSSVYYRQLESLNLVQIEKKQFFTCGKAIKKA